MGGEEQPYSNELAKKELFHQHDAKTLNELRLITLPSNGLICPGDSHKLDQFSLTYVQDGDMHHLP